jgi:hypothetical protein
MEGSYCADNGFHHKRKQVVLDGSEGWTAWGNFPVNDFVGARLTNNVIPYDFSSGQDIRAKCTHFPVVVNGETSMQNIGLRQLGDYRNIYLAIAKSELETEDLAGIKAWLSIHKPILQFKTAEEWTQPYSEHQQEQVESIKKATSYKGTTHIYSTNELSPIFDVVALGRTN